MPKTTMFGVFKFYNLFFYFFYKFWVFFLQYYQIVSFIFWLYCWYYFNYQLYGVAFCSQTQKNALTLISEVTGNASKYESRKFVSESICKSPDWWVLNNSKYSNSDKDLFTLNAHMYNSLGFSYMTKCQNHFPTNLTELTASLYLSI